jgi:hypothetical protein
MWVARAAAISFVGKVMIFSRTSTNIVHQRFENSRVILFLNLRGDANDEKHE